MGTLGDVMFGLGRGCVLAVSVVGLLLCPVGAAATVVNPDAEQDGGGWAGTGARFATYGQGDDVPSTEFSSEQRVSAFQRGLGARLFALGPTGRLEQVVDVSEWAADIDAGTKELYAYAWLGADGPAEGGTQLTATPLDDDGVELAPPEFTGPPTRSDRAERTLLLPCGVQFTAPAGTRQVRLALAGVGGYRTAGADAVYLDQYGRGPTLEGYSTKIGWPVWGGQGKGCARWDPTPRSFSFFPPAPPDPGCARGTGGPTPGVPAPQPPAPPSANCPPSLRISRVTLTRSRLSVRVSTKARLNVRIARRTGRTRAPRWRGVRRFTVRARTAGRVTRRFRPLLAGRYRISIRSAGLTSTNLHKTLRPNKRR